MYGFESKLVDVGGGLKVHVIERKGVGGRSWWTGATIQEPIVFLHGWPDSWRSFQRVITLIGRSRTIIAVDQLGFGDSSKPEAGPYDVPAAADTLKMVMDSMNISQIGNLVGHSMGAYVGTRFAALDPTRVKKLTLIGASPDGLHASLAASQKALKNQTSVTYEDARTLQVGRFIDDAKDEPQWFVQTMVHEAMQAPLAVWRAALAGMQKVNLTEAKQLLPKIQVEVLLIRGVNDTTATSEAQLAMMELLPRSTLLEVENAGHCPHWEGEGAVKVVEGMESLMAGREVGIVPDLQKNERFMRKFWHVVVNGGPFALVILMILLGPRFCDRCCCDRKQRQQKGRPLLDSGY